MAFRIWPKQFVTSSIKYRNSKSRVIFRKKSGCLLTLLGVESGNEQFRREVLNRHHSNSELIQKAELLRSAGIRVFSFNIVGFPFEERRHLRDAGSRR